MIRMIKNKALCQALFFISIFSELRKEKTMNDDIMTAQEVAAKFFEGKISYQKVLRLTRSGKLPAVKLGKGYVYRRSVLETWLTEACRHKNG